jgi:molybdenum cofactor biosynthesis protein MoaC
VRDISGKPPTLRIATADAVVEFGADVRELLDLARADKGDALEAARLAGTMAAKRTWELIPLCHQVPVSHVTIDFELLATAIRITSAVKCIAPTGVEMEALSAASVAALTIYDMVKPHTSAIEIAHVRLLEKRGGKSDYLVGPELHLRAAVLVLSDSVAEGVAEDRSGPTVVELLNGEAAVDSVIYEVLPDDPDLLQTSVKKLAADAIDLVITVGGTGLGRRDRTVEALLPLLDFEVPGIAEVARAYGQQRTRYAMLSRGIAGVMDDTLVVAFPGSTKAAVESYRSLFPPILHAFQVIRGAPHNHGGEQ